MTQIAKSSYLFYSRFGVGKSTQARYIAQYIRRKLGKRTRVVALDTGSLGAPLRSLIDDGTVEGLLVPTAPEYNPMAIMRKIRRGEWPKDGVINKPTRIEEKGAVRYKSNTEWLPWKPETTAEVGAYFVDSLTEYANSLMYDAKAKNLRTGDDASSQPRVEDGEQIGTNTRNHYADAQGEVVASMTAFCDLPIEIVAFTALEDSGTDDDTGVTHTVLGPKIVGKKAIAIIPSKVTNCFHLTSEGIGAQKRVNCWYEDHPSELPRVNWPCKIGLEVDQLPLLWKHYPKGYIPLTLEAGIGEFLDFKDSLIKKEVTK